ncbi:UDP-N-acetylenolpyruvoylglucosamine reductase [Fagus crenata]
MAYMSYNKVLGNARRCNGIRGFRLNPRRFSVQRLRARFISLFKLLDICRSSYGQALKSLKKGFGRRRRRSNIKRNNSTSTSTRSLVNMNMVQADCRLRSFGRSNSFYAEAIADCLEFIKRSSLSVDQNRVIQR